MKNKKSGELCVCGYNAAAALCALHPERVRRLFFSAERAAAFGQACKFLAAEHRAYKVAEDDELERLSKSTRHQGVVAMCDPPPLREACADDLIAWAASGERVVILENVGNDHNLGAIVRSAAFFGIKTICLTGDEAASISTAAYRVAEGGMEHVEVLSISDPEALFKRPGRTFLLVGADSRGRARLDDPSAFPSGRGGWGLVMGNEEKGLSSAMKALCDSSVRIPGANTVESLNVAQAAAVFFSRISAAKESGPGSERPAGPVKKKRPSGGRDAASDERAGRPKA